MKELLEEEDKDAATAAAVSHKKKQAKKTVRERVPRRYRRTRRDPQA
jgi:hypothetical protein